MKNILIAGATGMIGGIILRECLASEEVGRVVSLVRKHTGKTHPKLKEVVHADFMDYSAVAEYFMDVDVAHYCIGVYTGQVPDEEFRKITVDYTRAFADVLKQESPGATLCFLSGQGADPKEKSRVAFARYKGMAENYLIAKQFAQLYIFRPGYIYPVEKRKEPNLTYRIFRRLYPFLKLVYPNGVITSEQLAGAMFRIGMRGTGKTILENGEIKNLP